MTIDHFAENRFHFFRIVGAISSGKKSVVGSGVETYNEKRMRRNLPDLFVFHCIDLTPEFVH